MDEDFIVVTTYDIDGAEIEKHIGLVQGSTVRAVSYTHLTLPTKRIV